jgi:thiamine-monophosphate kinase
VKVCELGEKGLIDLFRNALEEGDDAIVGDDCGVIDEGDEYLVITTDMLHRKTDFPASMSSYQIGWMTVAVNLSDIVSMGARPLFFVVAIGLPPDTDVSFVNGLSLGMKACASKYGVQIIGGDTDGHEELTLVGTAVGRVKKGSLVMRRGARVGDLLCVTGSLGSASAGLELISGEENILTKALLEPEPRVKEGISLSKYATSMTDMSDSLALSLHDLSLASRVGFIVYADEIPIDDEMRRFSREKIMDHSLYGGGDFELLFTIDPKDLDAASDEIEMKAIGEVVPSGITLSSDGRTEEIEPRGYLHL